MTSRLTRRAILGIALSATTAFTLAKSALAREYGRGAGMPWEPGYADHPYHGTNQAKFFTEHELETVRAIVARLIPSDESGPGAPEAGVAEFIDRQMAGFYGRGQHWYMRGPFQDGLDTQGYQSEHAPAQLYRLALAELDEHARNSHAQPFSNLSSDQQDQLLTLIDEEEIEFTSVSAKTFFDLILENSIEGFFCDPIYGGNRDMLGWRYVGFPGTRYDYRDFLDHDGKQLIFDPVSLRGSPEWNSQ